MASVSWQDQSLARPPDISYRFHSRNEKALRKKLRIRQRLLGEIIPRDRGFTPIWPAVRGLDFLTRSAAGASARHGSSNKNPNRRI